MTTAALREEYARSAERAKAMLKRGDKVRMIGHGAGGSGRVTYVFEEWDINSPSGQYFVSKSGIDELHPYNIERVNGAPVSFRDPIMTDAAAPQPARKPRADKGVARAKPGKELTVIDTAKDVAEIDHKPERARSPDEIRLGETRVDFASGFVGLVIARIDLFSGNVQFGLQPRGGGDNIPEAQFIDYHMLSKVDDGIADSLPPIDTTVTIKIGEEVEDIVSGIKGIVVERVIFQNGCVYFAMQPPASKKTPNVLPEVIRYPHKRLKSIGRGLLPKPEKVKDQQTKPTAPTPRGPGGPSRGAKSMRMA